MACHRPIGSLDLIVGWEIESLRNKLPWWGSWFIRTGGYDVGKGVRARMKCHYMNEGRKAVYRYRGAHCSSGWLRN